MTVRFTRSPFYRLNQLIICVTKTCELVSIKERARFNLILLGPGGCKFDILQNVVFFTSETDINIECLQEQRCTMALGSENVLPGHDAGNSQTRCR